MAINSKHIFFKPLKPKCYEQKIFFLDDTPRIGSGSCVCKT